MAKNIKFRVYLPFDCLFDTRWGFIRAHSGWSDLDLFPRFNDYCGRLSDDLTKIVPTLTEEYKPSKKVAIRSPRTSILTIIGNVFRQYASENPDTPHTLHITIDYAEFDFVPSEQRQEIADMIKVGMSNNGNIAHVTSICEGFENIPISKLRKRYTCLIVYSLEKFLESYNFMTRLSFQGVGIITRPFFDKGRSPEEFHAAINRADTRDIIAGNIMDVKDHYEILSNHASVLGPIYFYEPQYFSAIQFR